MRGCMATWERRVVKAGTGEGSAVAVRIQVGGWWRRTREGGREGGRGGGGTNWPKILNESCSRVPLI